MPELELYVSMWCGFCHRAKALLREKGLTWTEYDVDMESGRREEMQRRGGQHTVPQIFIGGQPIGGCDELYMLDKQGKLDRMLGLAGGDSANG